VAPGWLDPYTVGAHSLGVANDVIDDGMNVMSCRYATSRPSTVCRRDDRSPSTIAALLHSIIKSPYTITCPLCVASRPALYYHHPVVSMSYTHLMLPIHHIWLSYTHLMLCLLRVAGEVMMRLMSSVLGMHGHASKACGSGRVSRPTEYFPFACGP
jgi:hypothetical protein